MFEVVATLCTLVAGSVTTDCQSLTYTREAFDTKAECEFAREHDPILAYSLPAHMYGTGKHDQVVTKTACLTGKV